MDTPGAMLNENAARLFARQVTPQVLREAEQGVWAREAWVAVEEAGLTRALVPERSGGYGVEPRDALGLLRVAGEYAAPVPLAETMLALWLLAESGLPIIDGPLTIASQDNLSRVPWARYAAGIVLLRDGEIALFRRDGCRVEQGVNLAHEPRDRVLLASRPEAAGPAAISPVQFRAACAALRVQQIAGALTRITDMTVQYAQERVQFGRPIGRFQAVQQNLAVLAGQTAAANAAADLAAEGFSDGVRVLPIAAAKARASEAVKLAAGIAHQAHGAIGFTQEHSLHYFTKRLWSWRDEFGNETEWNALLGRHIAAQGASRLWPEITSL